MRDFELKTKNKKKQNDVLTALKVIKRLHFRICFLCTGKQKHYLGNVRKRNEVEDKSVIDRF
jgi:hypothetical protein